MPTNYTSGPITKRVNITTTTPVRTTTPPIDGTLKNVIMTSGDILKCLVKRAIIHEILPDGKLVKLTLQNYYKDNGAGLNVVNNAPTEPANPKPINPENLKIVSPTVPEDEVVVDEAETTTEEVVDAVSEDDTPVEYINGGLQVGSVEEVPDSTTTVAATEEAEEVVTAPKKTTKKSTKKKTTTTTTTTESTETE